MKNIAVFTSGGDAPGMNAAIRAIVRAGIYYGLEVIGIKKGFKGMIEGDFTVMDRRSVSNIIQRGGTILKTSRSREFLTFEWREKAVDNLRRNKVDGLISIGGNGTFKGLIELNKQWDGKIMGLPGTIDNDLYGTDYTIGFHTAVNTALEAIDKIRDTVDAYERIFIVEVMGRHAGFIATYAGIGGGAEEILIPERPVDVKKCAIGLMEGKKQGKTSSIIVVAEGIEGGAQELAKKIKKESGISCRVVILGYIQRGGSPIVHDRILASKLGVFSVEKLLEGADNVMAGEVNGECKLIPLEDAVNQRKSIDPYKLKIASILSI